MTPLMLPIAAIRAAAVVRRSSSAPGGGPSPMGAPRPAPVAGIRSGRSASSGDGVCVSRAGAVEATLETIRRRAVRNSGPPVERATSSARPRALRIGGESEVPGGRATGSPAGSAEVSSAAYTSGSGT